MKFYALVIAIAFVAIVESKPQINRDTLSADKVATLKLRIEDLVGPLKQLQTELEGVAAPVFKGILNNIKELIGEIQSQADSIPSSSLPAGDVYNIVNGLKSKINGQIDQVNNNWDSLPSDAIKIRVNDAKFNLSVGLQYVSNISSALFLWG